MLFMDDKLFILIMHKDFTIYIDTHTHIHTLHSLPGPNAVHEGGSILNGDLDWLTGKGLQGHPTQPTHFTLGSVSCSNSRRAQSISQSPLWPLWPCLQLPCPFYAPQPCGSPWSSSNPPGTLCFRTFARAVPSFWTLFLQTASCRILLRSLFIGWLRRPSWHPSL